MTLYGYFRSSAAWRVRIALGLKNLHVTHVHRHLRRGEHNAPDYLALNPQGLLPALQLDDGRILTQSLAIIEWLDETWPQPPLLPSDPYDRARVRAFALAIACDIHPLQNLRVLGRVKAAAGEEAGQRWAADVNREGLAACEKLIASEPGPFCFGASPTLADICLMPQLGNARRFGVDVAAFPRLLAAETAARALPAFALAAPEHQPDAE
ncbi:MAG: maleylacetoacetate isomerase [Hyphomicrobiales bacterium]|nr:maleylacetoacetate isomerase [Hyphomicrobiales bacterium]